MSQDQNQTQTQSQTERIMFPCSPQFKSELEALAASQNKSVSQLIKEACKVQYKMKVTLDQAPRGKVSKYATQAEREAANKAYRKNRQELQRKLMAEYRAKHPKG